MYQGQGKIGNFLIEQAQHCGNGKSERPRESGTTVMVLGLNGRFVGRPSLRITSGEDVSS